MPAARSAPPGKVEVRAFNSDYATFLEKDKYDAMKAALLKVLPKKAPGLTQAEMFAAVRPHLPDVLFPGGAKSEWWAKTVQLDLESRKVLERETTKPLRWHRA